MAVETKTMPDMAAMGLVAPSSHRSPNSSSNKPEDLGQATENQVANDNGAVQAEASESRTHSKATLAFVLLALCLAVFLAAVDATLITSALPTIAKELGASDAGFAWIGSAYLLALATTAPFWSKVSDIFGRKPIILLANVVFLVGSLIAALANGLGMLIAGRTIQGAGGGGLITLVEISVGDMFSQRFVALLDRTNDFFTDMYILISESVVYSMVSMALFGLLLQPLARSLAAPSPRG